MRTLDKLRQASTETFAAARHALRLHESSLRYDVALKLYVTCNLIGNKCQQQMSAGQRPMLQQPGELSLPAAAHADMTS